MNTQPVADPLIGRLVDGRYRVRGRIARGGMAAVYLATDLRLERRVALKVMHGHLSDDKEFQQRFIQEARSAARLSDPNVVPIYDQGQDGEIAYLVMEYLPGVTLRELLREQGQLSVEQTVGIMDSVLSGLSAAHRADIVHRDIKPENVLLAEDGRIKLGDFGLARATSANTATGQQLLGTIAYLAPELVTRGSAGARSDIYALGVMLYEMLTGQQPFRGDQPMQIAYQHANEPMPRPSAINPKVPDQLDDLVIWATEKNPDERPANAGEMLASLKQAERELSIVPAVPREAAAYSEHSTDGSTKVLLSDDATAVLTGPPAPPVVPSVATPNPASDAAAAQPILPEPEPDIEPEPVDSATMLRVRSQRRSRRFTLALLTTLALSAIALLSGLYFTVGDGANVAVPNLVGQTKQSAQALLIEQELTGKPTEQYSQDVAEGRVIEQNPGAGASVAKQSDVTYTVSRGREPVEFTPSEIVGLSKQDAEARIAELGLVLADPIEWFSEFPADQVTNLRTAAKDSTEFAECDGTCKLLKGDQVKLSVSMGAVPNVVGLPTEEARQILTNAGLNVAAEPDQAYDAQIAQGNIVSVRMNETVWRGDEVTLVESLGPELFAVPNVVGLTRDEAVAELEALGFQADVPWIWTWPPNSATSVSGQDPDPDTMLPAASTISLSF